MKSPIIIVNVKSVQLTTDTQICLTVPAKSRYEACLVIAKDSTHFRCIKNRWGNTYDYEVIPNFLIGDYLSRYEEHFTKEDLFRIIQNLMA
jgi:hypothetical protein